MTLQVLDAHVVTARTVLVPVPSKTHAGQVWVIVLTQTVRLVIRVLASPILALGRACGFSS